MADLLLDYLTPESLGLDSKRFPKFRDIQLDAIEKAVFSEKRFTGLCIPTGGGKSLVAMAIANYLQKKTMILTHTKGLQDQYQSDFLSSGLVDIRGQQNYPCIFRTDPSRGEYGTCRDGAELGCPFKGGKGCNYELAKRAAEGVLVNDSNYAYWLAVNQYGLGLSGIESSGLEPGVESGAEENLGGKVELLIMDEAHNAGSILSDFLGFRLYEKEVANFVDPVVIGDKVGDWVTVAKQSLEDIKQEIKTIRQEMEFVRADKSKLNKLIEVWRKAKSLYERMYKLSQAEDGEWICEKQDGTKVGRVWSFDVIWPGRSAEKYLFCGVPRVIAMGATIRPKSFGFIGVGRDEFDFYEWPRVFPPNRNPMYFYPLVKADGKALRISRSTSEEELKLWVEHNDKILDLFRDRRCVVITTSYKYQEFFKEHSRHGQHFFGNSDDPQSGTAREEFEKFIVAKPPAVLCSPSFGTGWDFKGKRGEVLIIPKVPLRPPPSASKLMAARLERDKEYANYETMQDVVQWAGRVMREEEDRGTVVISDGAWEWFSPRSRHLAPKKFVEGVRRVNRIVAMEKL